MEWKALVPPVHFICLLVRLTASVGLVRAGDFVFLLTHSVLLLLLLLLLHQEGEFFPKWLSVLRTWLSAAAEPDFAEVSKWYTGWRGQFSADITKHARIVPMLQHALSLMNMVRMGLLFFR